MNHHKTEGLFLVERNHGLALSVIPALRRANRSPDHLELCFFSHKSNRSLITERPTSGALVANAPIFTTNSLAAVDANYLEIYYVRLKYDEPDEQKRINQANKVFQDLSNDEPLHRLHKLSKIENGLPEGMVHILVQLSPNESIHLWACGAAAETHLHLR